MENKFRWCYNPTVSVLILNISGINSLSKSIRLLDRIKHFTCCMSHFWQIYSSLAKISSLHDGLYPPLSLVSDATLLGHYLQTHQNVQSLCLCLHMYCWLCLACPSLAASQPHTYMCSASWLEARIVWAHPPHNLLSPSALLPTTLSTSATVLMREPVKRRSHKYPFVATGCLGQVSGKLLAAALRANSRRLRSNTVRVTRPRSPGTGQVCCGLLVHCVISSRKDLHEAGGIITPLSR